ncbi:MAG: SDR family oxidoreductase [Candidatus Micrarchaeia archaeon]
MKVVVFGAGGLVGSYACRAFKANGHSVSKVLGPSSPGGMDASDFSALSKHVAAAKPDIVFNAIKSSLSTDMSETSRLSTWSSNVSAPENLARLGQEHGFLLVHISSDWVYEGKEGVAYTEESPMRPLNFYAHTKAVAEEKVRAFAPRHLILRTTGVFGLDPRKMDFFSRFMSAAKSGAAFPAADDQFSQPIYAGELARIAAQLAGAGCSGTYNAVGPDYVSRHGLALLFAASFGHAGIIRRVHSSDRKIKVPMHLKLDISKLGKVCEVKSLAEQIKGLKEETEVQAGA